MASTTKRKRRRRRKAQNRWQWLVSAVVALLLAACGFVIQNYGGRYGIPTWSDLYNVFGITANGPDAALLADTETTVTVLDVGQGDAVLVGQDGNYCLIDTGTAESQNALVRALRQAGIQDLEYLVLTHPHADHTGGAVAVLQNFPVGEVLLPVWRPAEDGATDWPDDLWVQAAAGGTTVSETQAGDRYTLGDGVLEVLLGGNADTGDDDPNNASLCLLFEAENFRYLATGDAEKQTEKTLVDRYGSGLQANLYKAGHHGSSTSSSAELLAVVRPQAAVISCGVDNDYGHPHAETLQRLADVGAAIYRTDTMGTITFTYENGVLSATTAGQTLDAAA